MEILLVRHAPAEDRRPGRPDAGRRLTARGVERFERAVDGLERLEVRLDGIWHSPLLRAVETARILARLLPVGAGPIGAGTDGEGGPGIAPGRLVETPRLAEPPGEALLDELEGARVALVGHEPWLSQLLELLLGCPPSGSAFELKKGAVARLEGEARPGGARLCALWPPRTLRRLGQ